MQQWRRWYPVPDTGSERRFDCSDNKARNAGWTSFPKSVPRAVADGLAKAGINKLYVHQAEAIDYVMAGRNTVVTTSTSSGKSLIYTVPVFSAFFSSPDLTALYVTPAKALGQNRRKTMRDLAGLIPWGVGEPVIEVYNGDTPPEQRRQILQSANLIITTPDMLHFTFLPQQELYYFLPPRYKSILETQPEKPPEAALHDE